jgi:glycosyltransferase involved in cell wall biosynthesis
MSKVEIPPPLVSIIIPVYNREKIIEETVYSALNQTYGNLEIIISDNCSTDRTWKILQNLAAKDDRIKLLRNSDNLGPVKNWKVSLDAAEGEYCKILWSDDLITSGFVDACLRLFDEETAFVMSGIKIFDDRDPKSTVSSEYQNCKSMSSNDYIYDVLIAEKKQFPVSPGAALFRTKDLNSAYIEEIPNCDGLKFSRFGAGNDLLFLLKGAVNYKTIKFVNTEWSLFRSHKNSLTIANDLGLYYEYAKLFFINGHAMKLKEIFKAKIFLKKIKNKGYVKLYNAVDARLSLNNLFRCFRYRFL